MVTNTLIESCHCYADEEGILKAVLKFKLYPFSYSIASSKRHGADSFMDVKTLRFFDFYPNVVLMDFLCRKNN